MTRLSDMEVTNRELHTQNGRLQTELDDALEKCTLTNLLTNSLNKAQARIQELNQELAQMRSTNEELQKQLQECQAQRQQASAISSAPVRVFKRI
jgi:predicted RNase H-like nuclease (RuvC/YqgF family)